jgi:hypothetical protein
VVVAVVALAFGVGWLVGQVPRDDGVWDSMREWLP